MKTLRQKVETVLASAYLGLHNVPGTIKETNEVRVEVCVPFSGMCTWDVNTLTLLVIGCHDECVRMSMRAAGPHKVMLMFHDRTERDGDWFKSHPTMEQAIKTARESRAV